MKPWPYGTDPLRGWPGLARPEALLEARKVWGRAARRSGEDARAVLGASRGATDPAFPARLGDLGRAQWFLWAWATLAAGERAGRASVDGVGPLLFAGGFPSPRALVLGTVASDLYLGYAALRERARWFPGLVRDEDRELQHRRGAARVLDAAESLGGTLIKAGQFASTRPMSSSRTESITCHSTPPMMYRSTSTSLNT